MAEAVGAWSRYGYAGQRQKLSRHGVRGAANAYETGARGDTQRHSLSRL